MATWASPRGNPVLSNYINRSALTSEVTGTQHNAATRKTATIPAPSIVEFLLRAAAVAAYTTLTFWEIP